VPPLGKSKQNLRKSEQFDLRLVLNLGVYVCERERERRGERERERIQKDLDRTENKTMRQSRIYISLVA
jgi:hypothetical protein